MGMKTELLNSRWKLNWFATNLEWSITCCVHDRCCWIRRCNRWNGCHDRVVWVKLICNRPTHGETCISGLQRMVNFERRLTRFVPRRGSSSRYHKSIYRSPNEIRDYPGTSITLWMIGKNFPYRYSSLLLSPPSLGSRATLLPFL